MLYPLLSKYIGFPLLGYILNSIYFGLIIIGIIFSAFLFFRQIARTGYPQNRLRAFVILAVIFIIPWAWSVHGLLICFISHRTNGAFPFLLNSFLRDRIRPFMPPWFCHCCFS